jgi:hypothetical protein
MEGLKLEANLSPEQWALEALKEELLAGELTCEFHHTGGDRCSKTAEHLVRLNEKVYPVCDVHTVDLLNKDGNLAAACL